jgi:hypothetical protein
MRCGDAACDLDMSSSSFPGVRRFIGDYRRYAQRMTILARAGRRSVARLYCFLFLNVVGLTAKRVLSGGRKAR